MGRFYLDSDEKKIVKAVIHSDEKRQKRQQAGKEDALRHEGDGGY